MTHRAARRLTAALAAVVVVAGLAGCAPTGAAVATRARAFRPAPEVPPIERLGRWDGAGFQPVAAGSVRSGHLYVLVHGWAPGYRAAVERHRGPGVLLAWSPQAVDGQGERFFTSFFPLAAAITAADPGATVLGFSWIDDSATAASPLAAWRSEARTDLNGQRLAAALRAVVGPGFAVDGALHLMGHSHGAKVATVGAIASERAPVQLTLLDSPEDLLARLPGAANRLEGYLPLLPLGRGPGRTFVDSYFSIAGARYGDRPGLGAVVDTQLFPPRTSGSPSAEFTAAHEYPVGWYATSAAHLDAGVGLAWSPLVGTPPLCLVCSFRQRYPQTATTPPARELALVPAAGRARPALTTAPLDVTARLGPDAGRRPQGVVLDASGRRLWQVELDRHPNELALAFDVRFVDPAPGAQVAVWLDDRQVDATAADWVGATGTHAVVDTSALRPGRHTLTVVLAPPARRGRAVLGGFTTISRPGPAAAPADHPVGVTVAIVALVAWFVVGILIWVLHPRRRAARRAASVARAAER